MKHQQSICLITGGLTEKNLRLQPWRYLYEVASQLNKQGHQVSVISSNGSQTSYSKYLNGLTVHYVPDVSAPWWRVNRALQKYLEQIKPDVILWHVGLTSFLHQRLNIQKNIPVVGIFTSPIYDFQNLYQAGLSNLITGYKLSSVHVIGTLTPREFLRQFAQRNRQIHSLVVQTQTTRQQLVNQKLWSKPIAVIEPGVDKIWYQTNLKSRDTIRAELGYHPTDNVVVYFGSPAPLRGLQTLIKAFELAHYSDTSLKLLILSRRHPADLIKEDAASRHLLNRNGFKQSVQIVSGYLEQERLVDYVAAGDIVALPFELVPSDAPLSLLEAQAIGKPVVTTNVACLPELTTPGTSYLAQPANPDSLAGVLIQAAGKSNGHANSKSTPSSARNWQQVGLEWSQLIQSL